jgi:hypothetical protein
MMHDFAPRRRGYVPVYRTGTLCPGCGAAKWNIGRFSAECACCGTALTLAPIERQPPEGVRYPAGSVNA